MLDKKIYYIAYYISTLQHLIERSASGLKIELSFQTTNI